MTLTVKPNDRVNGLEGWWWISRKVAKQLCGQKPLPRMGYEVEVKSEVMECRFERSDGKLSYAKFPVRCRAYVANICGRFQLRDSNRLLAKERH